ncbi:hypothetical protein [Myxosarcina sp. GI1]|uniref:hypothetical protein n=1 Tax=Myxosarcina sp. GI1 TaxID=1541065 RepID=UPI0005686A50|nr:hypothetical protein [Myxosarcina sp. GI1]
MAKETKTPDITDVLKQSYGINKNITDTLTKKQAEELLSLLENNETVLAFARAIVAKNNWLANNNRSYGRQRKAAEIELTARSEELEAEREKSNNLSTQISQLKEEFNAYAAKFNLVLNDFHQQLVKDMLSRSEIILIVEKLLKIHSSQVKKI